MKKGANFVGKTLLEREVTKGGQKTPPGKGKLMLEGTEDGGQKSG